MGNSGCCNSNAALGQTGSATFVCQKQVPNCVRGACSEGKMTCGEIKEVRAFFRNLGEETV